MDSSMFSSGISVHGYQSVSYWDSIDINTPCHYLYVSTSDSFHQVPICFAFFISKFLETTFLEAPSHNTCLFQLFWRYCVLSRPLLHSLLLSSKPPRVSQAPRIGSKASCVLVVAAVFLSVVPFSIEIFLRFQRSKNLEIFFDVCRLITGNEGALRPLGKHLSHSTPPKEKVHTGRY